MYFDQCKAVAMVSMQFLYLHDDHVMDITASRLFEKLTEHARENGIPDFRAEDCDIHTHGDEDADAVEVAMVWNPQPGHIELLGGPQDGLEYHQSDADRDVLLVSHPEPEHGLHVAGEPDPEPSAYARWKINGDTRKWVFRYVREVELST